MAKKLDNTKKYYLVVATYPNYTSIYNRYQTKAVAVVAAKKQAFAATQKDVVYHVMVSTSIIGPSKQPPIEYKV